MNRSSVSLPRALVRSLAVLAGGITVLAATAGVAAAHVSVASADAAPGGFGKLTFRVPNESDTAGTVAIRIQIPEEAAMASVRTQPVPGWTVTTTTAELPEPLEAHGQEITSYVSVVEFRAEDGGIAPGEFQEFSLSGGPFPDVDQMAFPTVQTYSDGSETAWIEPTVAGQPEPASPAPVLKLAPKPAAPTSSAPTSTGAGSTAAGSAGTGATSEASDSHSHAEAAASDPGAPALFLAILALLVGGTGAFLGWRAHRRTVSS
jgi:uncharacterized protein YcnI